MLPEKGRPPKPCGSGGLRAGNQARTDDLLITKIGSAGQTSAYVSMGALWADLGCSAMLFPPLRPAGSLLAWVKLWVYSQRLLPFDFSKTVFRVSRGIGEMYK